MATIVEQAKHRWPSPWNPPRRTSPAFVPAARIRRCSTVSPLIIMELDPAEGRRHHRRAGTAYPVRHSV